METRTIREIAREVRRDWKRPYFGAVPYLSAMMGLESIDEQYGYDSARSIVVYFLSNASTWRGETARRVKAELRRMVK